MERGLSIDGGMMKKKSGIDQGAFLTERDGDNIIGKFVKHTMFPITAEGD